MADASPRVTPVPFPEGVASPDGRVGFVELRDGGGVLAVDLATGAELWRAHAAARPRLVNGAQLIAEDRERSRDNRLQFVALDLAREGAAGPALDAVVLPDWVAVADPDQVFEYALAAEGGELVIEWRAASHYAGGAPPPAHLQARAQHEASGLARLNLQSGRLVTVSSELAAGERTQIGPIDSDQSGALASLVPPDARAVCRVGGRVFYLVEPAPRSAQGPRLVSVDGKTGNEHWALTLPARPMARPPARRM